jgi:hypothetical protein
LCLLMKSDLLPGGGRVRACTRVHMRHTPYRFLPVHSCTAWHVSGMQALAGTGTSSCRALGMHADACGCKLCCTLIY